MYISTRIKSSKLLNQYLHDTRLKDIDYKLNDTKPIFLIDNVKNQSFYDTYIDNCKTNYKEKIKQKAQEKTTWAIDGIITFGKGFKTTPESDKAAIEFINNLAKEHNTQVLYLVKHTDETTHHYHYQLSTQNTTTGKSIRSVFNNKEYLSNMQDSVANIFQKYNIEVVRGKKKEQRIKEALENNTTPNTKHLTVSQSHYVAIKQISANITKTAKYIKNQELLNNEKSAKNLTNKDKLLNYKKQLDNEKEQNLQDKEKLLEFEKQLNTKANDLQTQEQLLEENKASFKEIVQIKYDEIEKLALALKQMEDKIKILENQLDNAKNIMDARQQARKYEQLAQNRHKLIGKLKEFSQQSNILHQQALNSLTDLESIQDEKVDIK